MTSYGTIPTSSSPSGGPPTRIEYITRAKERIYAGLSYCRPWKVMFDYHSLNFPRSFGDATARIKTNLSYFRMNYAIVVLFILFCSLLWHPISLIVFIVMMAAWLFLYFLRDQPLMIIGRTIDDRVVLIVLSVLTLLFLFLTGVAENILVSLLVGVVVVVVHAAVRKTDDLFLDEESTGLMTAPGGSSSS